MSTTHLASRIKRTRGLEKLSLLRSFPLSSSINRLILTLAPVRPNIKADHPYAHLAHTDFSAWHAVRHQVAGYSAWAAIVWLLNRWKVMPAASTAGSLVGILSMATGMLVGFRMSTAYDRWYEGRRTWASIQSTTRTFIRLLIFSLPPPSSSSSTPSSDPQRDHAIRELCYLVCAFPFACMYKLRDEPGVTHRELARLLPPALVEAYRSTPSSARSDPRPSINPSSSTSFVESSSATESERAIAGLNAPPSSSRYIPRALPTGEPSNLPLSLIRATHAYLNAFHETKMPSRDSPEGGSPALDGATWASCIGALKEYSDQLTSLERIRDTPIPLILNLHFQLLIFVYLAAVPLQLVRTIGIWTIPATAIASAVFCGVDSAAEELSDPFGEQPNDLPIARFCADLYRETREMLGEGGSNGEEWLPDTSALSSSSSPSAGAGSGSGARAKKEL
ncbi:hypothetical protein JCM11251_001573 [Rhodosporidiobolus azoricus]